MGVLSPERFSKLLTAGKIEFPTVTEEEIKDCSKLKWMDFKDYHAKHCGSSPSVLREELNILTSLWSIY